MEKPNFNPNVGNEPFDPLAALSNAPKKEHIETYDTTSLCNITTLSNNFSNKIVIEDSLQKN